MSVLDIQRSVSVFNPEFLNEDIHIIGCGATGSKVVIALAKLGIPGNRIHVWDYDIVEQHNIGNQYFGIPDIGKKKVDAAFSNVKRETGIEIVIHPERFVDQKISGYVFLLTDTMSSRKEIWENSLKFNTEISLVIETRMGIDLMRTYCIETTNPDTIDAWESSLCEDDDAEVSACGGRTSIGPTADILAASAVWQFMKAYAKKYEIKGDNPEYGILMATRPFTLVELK